MNNTRAILHEHKLYNDLYKDYGVAVNNLIENLLRRNNYKYHLSHRIKSHDSLREKIARKKLAGKIYKKLNDIEDIVGIRVVFYTDLDKKNFIRDLNKALNGTLRTEETVKRSGYHSTHAIVTFDHERTKLEEYKKFKGLKCELQMTLILDHAWAEVEHDIFYKEKPIIQGINKKHYCILKEKMEKVMQDYIQKASSGLENITRSMRRLEANK